MHFDYAETILRPADLKLLTDVLNRVCPVCDAASNATERQEIAARLLTLFRAGTRDQASLVELAHPAARDEVA